MLAKFFSRKQSPGFNKSLNIKQVYMLKNFTIYKTSDKQNHLYTNNEIAVKVQAKKVLVRAHIFSKPPLSHKVEYQPNQGRVHLLVIKNTIGKALLCQLVKKVHRPNMYNFWALLMI